MDNFMYVLTYVLMFVLNSLCICVCMCVLVCAVACGNELTPFVIKKVFKSITKQLPTVKSMHLRYVSPKLLEARDLQLAVPGSYHANEYVALIHIYL